MFRPFPSLATGLSLRLGVALVTLLAAALYTFWPRYDPYPFRFEVTIRSAQFGVAQLFYDVGAGINGRDSSRLPIEGGGEPVTYRFRLPEGKYPNLRFDPTDRAHNTMTLSRARIIDPAGHLFRVIAPAQIKAVQQIDKLEAGESEVTLTTSPTAVDPILTLELSEPLILKSFGRPSVRKLSRRFISFVFAAGIGLVGAHFFVVTVLPKARRSFESSIVWAWTHPRQLLLAVSAASVMASCYPIVFFGKSFLSPNNHVHTFLLYGQMPTVPGYKQVETDDVKGSDLGAPMWYTWPASVAESRAILKYFELPLWNRYNSGGLPLLGQGQSMFGDPLHLFVLLTNGSPGWWDLKYLLAKFLFAACLSLCVLQLTRHRPAAVIIAATAPFLGFFSYRYSHPAFFSMCYAPSILLCWFKLIDAPKGRPSALWLGMMVLADWTVMNSGTVKEAYIFLLAMNLCGCLTLLLATSMPGRISKLGQALLAQMLFVLIATPVWLTFLNTLRNSWTAYNTGAVYQIQPGLFIGLFDDIFYRQFNPNEEHLDPSANFLVLAGVLWFCFSRRRMDERRLALGLSITCLLALAFVFGIVPPSLILRLPFVSNIHHIDNVFSCVAIVFLVLLAGFGIKAFWNDCSALDFGRTCLRVSGCLALLLALYLGTTEAAQRSAITFLHPGNHIPKSAFFWGYSIILLAAVVGALWIGRLLIGGRRAQPWHILPLSLLFILLHWRHGMHVTTPFDDYVMNPQQRTGLLAESSASLNLIKDRAAEPFRTVGLNYDLTPGYGGAIGVELVDSVDPLLNKYYKSLMDASGVELLFGASHQGEVDKQLDTDLPLFEMLNVRYFLGHAGTKAEAIPSLKKIASLDLDVYESGKVWPRAFFSDRLAAYSAEEDFVRLLKNGEHAPFAAIPQAELNKHKELRALALPSSPPAAPRTVPATHYALTTNTTSFKVTAPDAGVIVLTEPYEEGNFQLRVNGKASEYFRLNAAFRGVFLPEAGEYNVSFSYWPRHLTISLWISALGIGLLLLWLGSAFTQSRRET